MAWLSQPFPLSHDMGIVSILFFFASSIPSLCRVILMADADIARGDLRYKGNIGIGDDSLCAASFLASLSLFSFPSIPQ